jgi:anti-sigma factor RsiW
MTSPKNHLTEDQLLAAAEGEALAAPAPDHLEACERCRADVRRLRVALEAVRSAPEPFLPGDLRGRLMDRFERRKAIRWALPRILTWRIPLYQAAGLAAAAVLLWSLLTPPSPRTIRVRGAMGAPAFHAAQSELVGESSVLARHTAAFPDSV